MAISQICKFEVKEELDHYVKEKGLSHREAARRLALQLTELMGEEVKAETLRKKAQRAEVGTSVPNDSTPPNHTKSPGNKGNKGLTKEGKPRQRAPGAGRKPSKHTSYTPPEYEVTEAMQFATIAISQLERIREDDPKREAAFEKVVRWITKQKIGTMSWPKNFKILCVECGHAWVPRKKENYTCPTCGKRGRR